MSFATSLSIFVLNCPTVIVYLPIGAINSGKSTPSLTKFVSSLVKDALKTGDVAMHAVVTTAKRSNFDIDFPISYMYFLKCASDLGESGASLGKSVSSLGKSVPSLGKDAPVFTDFPRTATQC